MYNDMKYTNWILLKYIVHLERLRCVYSSLFMAVIGCMCEIYNHDNKGDESGIDELSPSSKSSKQSESLLS